MKSFEERGKIFLWLFVILFFLVSFFVFNSFKSITGYSIYTQGDGSLGNPFVITNCTQLQAMNQNLTAHYILNNSINMSAVGCEQFQTGIGFEPIGRTSNPFSGSLKGNGYNITSLFVNNNLNFTGLFAAIFSANINNFCIADGYISGNNVSGGIVGSSILSTISNVCFRGDIFGIDSVGGLVGLSENDRIQESYFIGNINGSSYLGGLVGIFKSGNLTNSYSSNNIFLSMNYSGGLIGNSENSFISNSYAIVNISGGSNAGGIVGKKDDSTQILNTIYRNDSILFTNNYGTPKNSADMKRSGTYSGWDFVNIWGMQENNTFPYLGNPKIIDVYDPSIIYVTVSEITSNSSLINVLADRLVNLSIRWGLDLNLSSSNSNGNYILQHSITLTSLSPSKLYYYNLTLCNMASNCTIRGIYNFTTLNLSSNTTPTNITYSLSNQQLLEGNPILMNVGDRLRFVINNSDYFLTLENLTNSSATFRLSSGTQIKTLSIGQEWRINVSSKEVYQVLFKLNNVTNNTIANITIISIYEQINPVNVSNVLTFDAGVISTGPSDRQGFVESEDLEKDSEIIFWIVIGVIILTAMAAFTIFIIVKNNQKKGLNKYNTFNQKIEDSYSPPQIQRNPLLDQINSYLDRSLEFYQNNDKKSASEYYNKAKRIFEENKLNDVNIINRLYSISVSLDE